MIKEKRRNVSNNGKSREPGNMHGTNEIQRIFFKGTKRYVGIIGDQMLDELGEIQGTRRDARNEERYRELGEVQGT